MRHVLPGCAVVLALVTSVLVAPAGAPAMAGVAATCQGEPATVVGTPVMPELNGTDGDDVIVTGGAFSVHARAGDDLVCVTDGTFVLDAGAGDDDVHSGVGDGGTFSVDLGAGRDRFAGSAAADLVEDDVRTGTRDQRDVIRTGAGDDVVSTGRAGTRLRDVVELGSGDDELVLDGRSARRGARLSGGAGTDRMIVPRYARGADDLGRSAWLVDNRRGQEVARVGGRVVLAWRGIERFQLEGRARSYSFRGSRADEALRAGSLRSVAMGGGNDTVGPTDQPAAARLSFGPGLDRLDMVDSTCRTDLTIDLGARAYRCGSARAAVTGLERAVVVGVRGRVVGSSASESLEVSLCRGSVSTGGGRDQVLLLEPAAYLGPDLRPQCRGTARRPVVVDGGGGRDRLVGSRLGDVLLGGPGRDLARGKGGRDRCVAERERGCER